MKANANDIDELLTVADIKWHGLSTNPLVVQAALTEAKEVIGEEPVGTQYQRGGLIVRKETSETYDVYVFAGSLP